MQKKKITRRQPLKTQRLGGTTVSIQKVDKPPYQFALVMRQGGARVRERYIRTKGEAEALFQAWTIEASNTGAAAVHGITDDDKRVVLQFHKTVADWRETPTLGDAIRQFLKDHSRQGIGLTVTEAVDKQLHEMDRRKLSKRHINGTKWRLDRFSTDYGDRMLNSITSDELSHWLHGLDLSPISEKNYKLAINPLFKDALQRGELDRNPLVGMKLTKDRSDKIPEVFSPAEVMKLMAEAPDSIRAALAIQFFAGVRRSEVLQLQWEKVSFLEEHVEITAATAKTASRRLVPMTANLKAWLMPLAKAAGPVAPLPDKYRFDLDNLIENIGIEWMQNGMRHSYITYTMAITGDAIATANQAGNSPAIIHKNYKALATKREAKKYFAIVPDAGEKVVQMCGVSRK